MAEFMKALIRETKSKAMALLCDLTGGSISVYGRRESSMELEIMFRLMGV